MTRDEADIKMKDPELRSLWICEATGTMEEPYETKYRDGMLYVVWRKRDDEAEIYDTSNIYGECEDHITIKEYRKL